ncbi:hypothetical protein Tco_0600512 [Tanacetum coccineum]|uniref:Uncharacterized protein n=1 Tax=Tanacetum coccineum TaxID=301880 RepID=A0ABQ4WBY5_9ASTR
MSFLHPAVVFNDTLTSKATLSCEPTVSSLNNDEIDFRISFDESDDEDCTVTEAIAKYERNRSNPENARGSRPANAGGVVVRDVHGWYNNRFYELALMCPDLVTPEKKKIERYIRGLPERTESGRTTRGTTIKTTTATSLLTTTSKTENKKLLRLMLQPQLRVKPTLGTYLCAIGVRHFITVCALLVFTPFIDIAPAALDTSYDVQIAYGKVVSTNTVLRGSTLALFNHVFKIDLLLTRLGSFDVIVGMD